MTDEKDFLKVLRQSLDEEDDETSIISLMENHHKYLKEYISVFINPEMSNEDKRDSALLFFPIFNMHAHGEVVFYQTLQDATNLKVRLEGLKGQDEHEIAAQLIGELKELGIEFQWSEEINAKIIVLADLVRHHIKEEEHMMFPLAEEHIPESALIALAFDYLERCKYQLDVELSSDLETLEASRSDVITLFY